MAGVKGRSGTNRGKDKPFADALRMEIAEAGENHRSLRAIARKLLDKAAEGDMQAIQQVGDRLDGKPAQESTMTADVSEGFANLWKMISDGANTELADSLAQEPGQSTSVRH